MRTSIGQRCAEKIVLVAAWGLLGTLEPAGAYEADPAVTGVTVNGRLTIVGSVPRAELMPVHRDGQFCGETIPNEALQMDRASRGIAAAVISLEGVAKGKPLVPENLPLTIENHTCRFSPRVNASVVGSVLEIFNTDPILHNTHVRQGNRFGPTVINVAQPAGTKVIRKPMREVGFLDVRCDAHTFMKASIHVFEHPYFTVTDQAGQFELTQVPPGTYRLRIWHEMLGSREKAITVPPTGPISVDLELGLEE